MKLTNEQQNILKTISSPNCKLLKINAVSGAGKAQPLSEKILTPDGWKTMNCLEIGDKVIGSDGKSKTIIGTYPQGIRQIFKVSFIDGTSVLCDKDHLWTVHRNRYTETKTTQEMIDSWIEKKRLDKRYNTYSSEFNYSIDLVKPIEYSEQEEKLLINPYLLGLLLGDGGFSGNVIGFTNSSEEIINKVKNLLHKDDKLELNKKITYRISAKEKWKKSNTKLALIKYGIDGKLSSEKHIPKEYLYADIESRKQLLQGLIDSDGYVKNGQLIEYSTSSEQLANDFLELARSLGMNVSCKSRIPKYTYKNEKLLGKKNYRIRHLVSKKTKSIVSIEYSHDEEAKCIKIDAEDSLYVTNGFNLTHNTSTLIEIAKSLNSHNGLYMAYNKAIAKEASEKFGSLIDCRTIHSLAYGFTVKHFNLKLVSNLKPKIITERIEYLRKSFLLEVLTNYFLSRHVVIQNYIDEYYPDKVTPSEAQLLKSYFIKMKEGLCECSHDFYLKLFHIFLHHKIIKASNYDLLMLDEAGDVNGASLEIFRLLQSDKKVMVGDNQQNIYSFNQTINGFEALADEGISMTLSQSFRVSSTIAPYIEDFCHAYLDPSMVFKGVDYDRLPEPEDATFFYIARTNGGVVAKMIELEEKHHRYNLTRPVKTLFALPLLLMRLNKNPDSEIFSTDYKFLEEDMRDYLSDTRLQTNFKSPLNYIEAQHGDDAGIMSALNLLRRFEASKIINTYNKALEHEKHHETHQITVTSAHSSKGLESDSVCILDDMNAALNKVMKNQHDRVNAKIDADKAKFGSKWEFDPIKYEFFDKLQPNMDLLTHSEIEEFRLYYVACTRAKFQIENAEWLEFPDIYTTVSSFSNRGNF